jgi:Bacteriophage related domain of unknown function
MTAANPEARILEVLLTHLKAWSGGLPIVWPNVQYPVNGAPKADQYAVVTFSPGTPQQLVVDSKDENKHMGIFGVSILTLLNGGEIEPQEIGGSLASHFHGQVLSSGSTTVRVTARPRVAGGYVDGDRWRTPVTVPFETISV